MGTKLCHNFSSREIDLAFAVFCLQTSGHISGDPSFIDLQID
jgi:hypothetical protein